MEIATSTGEILETSTFAIETNHKGVIKKLGKFQPKESILEYVTNAIDAEANNIDILIEGEEIGYADVIKIKDDGFGMDFNKLQECFGSFLTSSKKSNKFLSLPFGKNAQGRLTFFCFAEQASWETKFKNDNKEIIKSKIVIDSKHLNEAIKHKPTNILGDLSGNNLTGTEVSFERVFNVSISDINEIKNYLVSCLNWYLELRDFGNAPLNITINSEKIKHSVEHKEHYNIKIEDFNFNLRFVRWQSNNREKYSKLYFLDENGKEKFKKNTTFNNNCDDFYHSLYIKSSFFNAVDINLLTEEDINLESNLFTNKTEKFIYFQLNEKILKILNEQRNPFLSNWADKKVIPDLKKKEAFPEYGSSVIEQYQKRRLEDMIKAIIIVEPKTFNNLNQKSAQILVNLLSILINKEETANEVLEIIEKVLNLSSGQRKKFATLLQNNELSGLINLVDLINRRFEVLEDLKQLVFKPALKANERDHIQKITEKNFWLFGEQFNLITANQTFTTAITTYRENKELIKDHKDEQNNIINFSEIDINYNNNRRPDIFLASEIPQNGYKEHIIIELKHPKIKLGREEHNQVQDYLNIIRSKDEFNSPNNIWRLYLIGNRYDENIKDMIAAMAVNGQKNLSYTGRTNYYIYVRTWSDIISEIECRYNFLKTELEAKRIEIIKKENNKTADEIIKNLS